MIQKEAIQPSNVGVILRKAGLKSDNSEMCVSLVLGLVLFGFSIFSAQGTVTYESPLNILGKVDVVLQQIILFLNGKVVEGGELLVFCSPTLDVG